MVVNTFEGEREREGERIAKGYRGKESAVKPLA